MPPIRIVIIATFCLFVTLCTYSILIEPNRVCVTHLEIRKPLINDLLSGKKAIHLSDLHICTIGHREEKTLKLINSINPDIIFLTGDYVKWKGDYEPAISFLAKLKAPLGVYAVMGDHDYSDSRKSCLFCHNPVSGQPTNAHQVRFLSQSVEKIKLPHGDLVIGGTDPGAVHSLKPKGRLDLSSSDLPQILLSHDPLNFKRISEKHEVLILSGDTHGGQIALPRWVWMLIGYQKAYYFNSGKFEQGNKLMYVNRGLGTSHLPVRFFRTPELVVLYF